MMPERTTRRLAERIFALFVTALLLHPGVVYSQFSPGDLSNPHHAFEGTENCIKCHEVGREISGAKCLGCHQEIQQEITARHGFHFSVSSRACVTCHKEHLGREAKTVQFDKKTFDHDQTGFPLDGKHGALTCDRCHASGAPVDQTLKDMLAKFPHRSYLGLAPKCNSCHRDPHDGKFKQECSACHTSTSWTSVSNFDHATTRFPLDGKHLGIACTKCHAGVDRNHPTGQTGFKTTAFADCTPCHGSPHRSKFENRECKSCHSTGSWSGALGKPFDHDMTRYRLAGRHAVLRCEQCHHVNEKVPFAKAFLLPHDRCLDCHEDKHHGELSRQYGNNCVSCHSERGFKPSTFTITRHQQTRFPLSGSHIAVTCSECHTNSDRDKLVFRFTGLTCETCHRDIHRGQFAALMSGSGCATCHTTEEWRKVTFDHSKTAFPLLGSHATAACSDCHKRSARTDSPIQFTKLAADCGSCHRDIHQQQFAAGGKTDCSRCHKPDRWTSLGFDHDAQSSFPLRGAHKNVECKACHRGETAGQEHFVRFKPLRSACAACHQQREMK